MYHENYADGEHLLNDVNKHDPSNHELENCENV